MPGFICESAEGCGSLAQPARELPAPVDVACSTTGVDWLVQHVENGLLEIFLLVCGSSAQYAANLFSVQFVGAGSELLA